MNHTASPSCQKYPWGPWLAQVHIRGGLDLHPSSLETLLLCSYS